MLFSMLKLENSNNTVNYSKEKIKFSGSKDAPKKLHSLQKYSKIATAKAPTRSTSFVQIHHIKGRNPRTFEYVQTTAPKNMTHTTSVSQ